MNDNDSQNRPVSPLPSDLVPKPKPEGEIIPGITLKLKSSPQTAVSRLKSCSKGAIETL